MERAYFTTALPLRSSKQQHWVLKTDTEYRRWYNKCKKSGASSFFENRGQLLRRFGNEHDYGGDADGWKNQSFAEVVIPRVDVDEDCEEEYCISVEEEDAPDGIFNKKRPACLSKSF